MVDWEKQWALFAPNYRNGHAHVDVKQAGTLKLKPGPGFGDFSHPTTRLCLGFLEDMMFPGASVLDIGCGSGILTLAAALLGAAISLGIDIDEDALVHACENKKLNAIKNAHFSRLAFHSFFPDIILMNMIVSEQKQAWNYKFKGAKLITSGILSSERDAYLYQAASWGFDRVAEKHDGEWAAFVFKI